MKDRAGIAQMARASAFQAEGRGFESRFPLQLTKSPRSSVVEHFLGKEEAAGSIPAVGSIIDEMQGPPGFRINGFGSGSAKALDSALRRRQCPRRSLRGRSRM